MKQKLIAGEVAITNRRRIETENCISWVPDGLRVGYVELNIDLKALLDDLGARAVRSKGGKATMASGAIVARRIGDVRIRRP